MPRFGETHLKRIDIRERPEGFIFHVRSLIATLIGEPRQRSRVLRFRPVELGAAKRVSLPQVGFLQAISMLLECVEPAKKPEEPLPEKLVRFPEIDAPAFPAAINPSSELAWSTSYPRVSHKSPAFSRHAPHVRAAPEQFSVNASRPSGAKVCEAVAQAESKRHTEIAIDRFIYFPIADVVVGEYRSSLAAA